jgi:hypothetical protein
MVGVRVRVRLTDSITNHEITNITATLSVGATTISASGDITAETDVFLRPLDPVSTTISATFNAAQSGSAIGKADSTKFAVAMEVAMYLSAANAAALNGVDCVTFSSPCKGFAELSFLYENPADVLALACPSKTCGTAADILARIAGATMSKLASHIAPDRQDHFRTWMATHLDGFAEASVFDTVTSNAAAVVAITGAPAARGTFNSGTLRVGTYVPALVWPGTRERPAALRSTHSLALFLRRPSTTMSTT